MDPWIRFFPDAIHEKYELYNFNNAVEILSTAYPEEFSDVVEALANFQLSTEDIMEGGGNESDIPKKFSILLHPKGWQEVKITGDLLVRLHIRRPPSVKEITISDFIDGHNIDYVKNRVALDLEWNSKDQTFDRDLYAFRTFYECGIISCGILITRSERMNDVFSKYGIMKKYGASTTWMGKLLPRINSRRHGGCPLLVVGITPKAMSSQEV
jgi:hypothetical protein